MVVATWPEGRQATGQRLTYDAGKGSYVVTGTPAQVVSRSAKGQGICDVATGTAIRFQRGGGSADVTNDGEAVGKFDEKKCAEVIK